jgi:hypothetical protein
MGDDDDSGPDEDEPMSRTVSMGLSLKVPPKAESDSALPAAEGNLTLLLQFQGQEWSTEVNLRGCTDRTADSLHRVPTRHLVAWRQVEVEKTIEYVKALALERFGALAQHKNLDLKLDGTSLMDPMSLIDYPQMAPGSTVRLECDASPA